MERLVESIRVQCPNAVHGCTARPTYYNRHCHCQTCPYTPWQCPGDACDFVGSMDSLLDHLAGLHGWSCPIAAVDNEAFSVCLHGGFNFFLVDVINGEDDGSLPTSQCLILMNVTRPAYGCTISVLCMLPDAAATASDQELSLKELQCELQYSHRGSGKLKEHDQKSKVCNGMCEFKVEWLPFRYACVSLVSVANQLGPAV
ncbi:hypothetical protein PR202_ga11292 [Eleusine coracana subsp. coracana]|uniref:SIAH-type domain-containing protein n=1 Tax=Eleusine coracana subsp. coracana TaxID=191504 RepID=A0AAV5C922_ELECO|nr:hypothetical protein PR202_ga11292 [Eleusine coracana subsp. coracana]